MPLACRIDCLSFRRDGTGRRTLGRLGGIDGDGRRWSASYGELIAAIESGEKTCYVTLHGHSHLVTVVAGAGGEKALRTLLGELESLPLPECPSAVPAGG